MKKNFIKSFSLVEVLVFVSILSLFFVAAAAVTTVSLRNTTTSEHKIIATHYANELLSWLRSKKEQDWVSFINHSGNTYCFNTPITAGSGWPSAVSCASDGLTPPIFRRQVTLSAVGTSQMNIVITVAWTEFGTSYQVPLNTVITAWE